MADKPKPKPESAWEMEHRRQLDARRQVTNAEASCFAQPFSEHDRQAIIRANLRRAAEWQALAENT